MASFMQQACLLSSRAPLIQFQRFRGKINIQRPRKPHYERAKVLAVTDPIYAELPKMRNCFQPPQYKLERVENPYHKIISREIRNWLEHSKMVGIFHLNSIKSDELFKVRVALHKENMHLKAYSKKLMEKAVQDTRFEAILPLFDRYHSVVFSTEQQAAKLLRVTRKVPQMLLMAAILENTLLSRNEFIAYAQHPGLETAQAELVQTLNMAPTNLVQQLQTHQNNFVNVLDVYVKEDDSAKSTESENANKVAEEEQK